MFTVKHTSPDGTEFFHQVRRAWCSPRVESPDGVIATTIWADDSENKTFCLGSWGAFYIMNEQGQTVQKYDLGGWYDGPKLTNKPEIAA